MEEYAYIEILVEDKSRGILVEQVLDKFIKDKQNIAYRIHSFKGIGKIPLKANRVSQIKTKRLLTDLPMYLKGMEAWLLGDSDALLTAYPMAKRQFLQKYTQDSIVGTWEYLADIVYKGGLQALRKNASSYYEIGMFKCECARNIGVLLDIRKNASPSFNYFIGKLDTFYESGT